MAPSKFSVMKMDSKPSTICIFSLFLTLHFLLSHAHASQEAVCNSTNFPLFCKSLLKFNHSATIHDYGRFCIHHSLATTNNLLSLVNDHLKSHFGLPKLTIHTLEDCLFLLDQNLDFLSTIIPNIDSKNTLQSSQAETIQTLLSAIITNQHTCLDGLQDSNSAPKFKNSLLVPLFNGSMLYSISLTLFMQGWVHDTKKTQWLSEKKHIFSDNIDSSNNGHLPLKMSSQDQKLYESLSGKKVVQTSGKSSVLVNQMVVVNSNGSGKYTTINEAVNAAPNNSDPSYGYFLIYVGEGVYEEYVSIPKKKKYLMMIGDGIGKTVITGHHSHDDGWSTFRSSTFAVVGEGFVAVDITFKNTAGPSKNQAVAVQNSANLSTFYRCSFEGYQDTLYVHCFQQFYRDCKIYGTIDFIFGNAAAIFQNCEIYVRRPNPGNVNFITAQSRTDFNQSTGISIHNCTILATDELALSNGSVRTFLGRPWRKFSRTVYMKSFMGSLIDPSGWSEWSSESPPSTIYYGEFENFGPGSETNHRIKWPGFHVMNENDVLNFTVSNFINGDYWLPATRVPYNGGL